ncbi:MAG: glycine oxidase ThiO [Acidimicrobiaceae bacterium]|nr:glycine oxidase ThiO [Acidimicrobiaceae bacterium]
MTSPDVVIVGAGVIGLSIAWRAAADGCTVTVCDPSPGTGASWAAAGMLAPVTEASVAEAPLTGLGLASIRRWPDFAAGLGAETGIDVGLRCEGTVAVAFDDDDQRALSELQRVHAAMGLDSEWLTRTECRQLEPLLSPRIRGALMVRGDWQVDNRSLLRALEAAATRRGVALQKQAVERIDRGCVWLAGGEQLEAGAVVVAAGAASGRLSMPEAARPPVRPVKGDILRLRGGAVLNHTVRAGVRGRSVYLVPRRDGELVVGATMEETGFDAPVRAGAVHELLDAAVRVLPGVAELEFAEATARLRPATPDNAPVLGPSPVPGVILATGHHRNGVLLTPVTADAIAAVLRGAEVPPEAAPFTIGRFL